MINNNIAVVSDSQGDEVIVIGKGLGFNKKKGDEIEEKKIEKRFYLEDEGMYAKFKRLLKEISVEEIRIADDIISLARKNLKRELNESIYVSLPDHISLAIQRFNEGISVKNPLLWEIKKLYKEEYLVAKKAVEMINERFSVNLGDDEKGFIAFHFVNAELNSEMPKVTKITKIINEIIKIIFYQHHVEVDEESFNGFRFITHLKFFAQRIVNEELINSDADEVLYDVVRSRYSTAFATTQKINEHISKKYNYFISDSEALYLTVHIQRLLERTTK